MTTRFMPGKKPENGAALAPGPEAQPAGPGVTAHGLLTEARTRGDPLYSSGENRPETVPFANVAPL